MLIGRLASPIGHGENHSSTHGAGKLNHLVDFIFGCAHPLRTCEVRHCSRLAVQRKHQRQMDQLLCLRVQRSTGVNIPEVGTEVLVCSEVWRPFREIRHVLQASTSAGRRPTPGLGVWWASTVVPTEILHEIASPFAGSHPLNGQSPALRRPRRASTAARS